MKYYEITPESPAHAVSDKLWNMPGVWDKASGEIKELLGCEMGGNLLYNAERLCLGTLRNIPDNLKPQFCEWRNGCYAAKKRSAINNSFLEISKKYNLYGITVGDVARCLGTAWHHGTETHYPPMFEKYYFKTERKIENAKGLIEIPEPEFLRLHADWLEKREG